MIYEEITEIRFGANNDRSSLSGILTLRDIRFVDLRGIFSKNSRSIISIAERQNHLTQKAMIGVRL